MTFGFLSAAQMSRESKRAQISLARIQQPPESMLDPTTLMLKQLVANALLMDDVLIHITELLAKRTKAEIAAKSFLLMIDMSGVRDRLAQYGVPESAAPFHIKLHSLEWLGSSDAKGMVGDGVAARANVVHLLNTAAKDPEDTVVLLYVKPDPLKPVMVFTTRLLSAAIHAIYSSAPRFFVVVCACVVCAICKLCRWRVYLSQEMPVRQAGRAEAAQCVGQAELRAEVQRDCRACIAAAVQLPA